MNQNDSGEVFEAFATAIDYFHGQLDVEIAAHTGACDHEYCTADECDRPTTAREYFTENRGWNDETLTEWKLGYAPGNGGLADHLRSNGYSEETMRSTGLFTKHLTALWRGRYVLPYFDADGTPVYAIARTTGSLGGGAAGYDGHPEDFLAGKYAKVAHSKDYVPIDEPIFGMSTLEQGRDVVIAEGIADAITAAEAGYSVLSPVTTQFKKKHFDELLELVRDDKQRAVYVVPDSERAPSSLIDSDDVPEEPDHIYQAVNIEKVAPGMRGALRTANHLRDHGVDARVVELPRPGLRKVDLDDYLHGWSANLDAVLATANPPQQHPDYETATETQQTATDTRDDRDTEATVPERPDTDSDLSAARTDGMSALWRLSVGDVNTDLEEGYRGKNPLGHTGNSEEYFHVFRPSDDGDLLAMDYKRKVKYCGVTYLLVEGGERNVADPEGPLTPEETWIAWSTARNRGLLGENDTIPQAALEYIAKDRNLYDFDALESDVDELPVKAHNKALAWVLNRWWDAEETDEEATSRQYKTKDPETVFSWEDIRYIYEESKQRGRQAAENLLRSKYSFMTVDDTDELHVYDDEKGIYTTKLSEVKGEIHDGLLEHWSTHELNEIEARLRQNNRIDPRHLNSRHQFDDPHICVENGVLNLFTRELQEHSPDYYFVDRVPVEYDDAADTEPFEWFVGDVTQREEDTQAMLEMVGHALLPDAYERYQKFLILHGATNNGKSVFYRCVTALLEGPESEERNISNVKLEKLTSNDFSTWSVYGNMANIAGEIEGKKIKNTAHIKDITGGDQVEIEPKFGKSFFDAINATLMFAANDPPIIGGRDKEAISERIVPVELPYRYKSDPDGPMQKEKIPERELMDKLLTSEALSGLLNLALDGIERLEDPEIGHGGHGDVSLPESPRERLELYEKRADPMTEFGHECLTNKDDDYVVKADVTSIYKEFASANGYEVGTNIHDVLHNVLKGVRTLNYTTSKPRNPDYSETSLPLRPWSKRKAVVDRVSLTDRGLDYARKAGLVTDEAADVDDEPEVPALASLNPGYQRSFTATVASHDEGEYSREAQGTLKGAHGTYIGFVVPGGNHNPLEAKQRETFYFEDVTIRTDDDGLLEAVINDAATITKDELAKPAEPDGDTDSGPQATADGGETIETAESNETGENAVSHDSSGMAGEDTSETTDDATDNETGENADSELGGLNSPALKPYVYRYVMEAQKGRAEGVPREEVVDELEERGADRSTAGSAIDKALAGGDLSEPATDVYRV